MQHHTIKVFQKTPEIAQLRFLSPEGKLIGERELSLVEIESFADEVERKYEDLSIDPTGSLPTLGRKLYEWLDGPTTRWLAGSLNSSAEMTLRIDVAEKLRHLPWELLYTDAGFLCSAPYRLFTPARLVTEAKPGAVDTHNRPLRTLFMACSAEDVVPLLNFEAEERMILDSARRHHIELFVEESGSLEGLRYQVEAFGRGHFDVFHLTGHAGVGKKVPLFLMENNQGLRQNVSAQEIAEAFQGNWPRLIFLSGCQTGQSPERGFLPSFCEALVNAGAPAVLGWALPVLDDTANLAAGELYGHLAAGKSIDESVARTRLHLFKEKVPDWHLLRLYVNATPLDGMVTAPKTKGRARLMVREAMSEFLDAGAKVEVCKREDFVGRRRSIQRCLRTLQSAQIDENYSEGVLLYGMGGLGKSSLAIRLCERMAAYKRIVFVGALDELGFITKFSDSLGDPEVIEMLNQSGLSITQRLRNLFAGPLSTQPIIFVLDDFEQNLEASGERYIAKSGPLEILKSLMTAIRGTNSESRVIVTSRYQFPLPSPLRLREEALEALRDGELAKKLTRLAAFNSDSPIAMEVRGRAQTLGAGNPRLLEWLNNILMDRATNVVPIMDAMEREAERFREEILLRELLAQLPQDCRRMIALASVYELPFDLQVIAAAVDMPLDPHIEHAVSLGLIERGIDSATGQSRYFASRVVLPLVETETTAEERTKAAHRAANHLYQARWKSKPGIKVDEAVEIFRLALMAREREITLEIGSQIANTCVNSNRYREAEYICQAALTLGENHELLLQLGRAQFVLGSTSEALLNYENALAICPASDLKGKSGILSNLAELLAAQGHFNRALELWQQSLEFFEQSEDIKGKAATLHKMAGAIAQKGNTSRALELWQQSLTLFIQVRDIKGEAAALHQMAGVFARMGHVNYALTLWQQSLALSEQINDARNKAATLSNMAGVIARQGDVNRALELWDQALALNDQIGNVRAKAATLSNIANVIAQQGDIDRALSLWQRSLAICEQLGDVKGKAVSLSSMAGVIAQQGNIDHALELWDQSLELFEQINDIHSKATVLHQMASAMVRQGDVDRALALWRQSLAIDEQTGDTRGKAVTLNNMAGVIAEQGDVDQAFELWQQSIEIYEQIGDVRERAVTLNNMGWLAAKQEDLGKAERFFLESGKLLVTIQSWFDVITVLSSLSTLPINGASGYLTQAVWLSFRVETPPEMALKLTSLMMDKLGAEHEFAPLLGTAGLFIAHTRGQRHSEQEKLVQHGANMLGACAKARKIESQEEFQKWFTNNGLDDPNRFLPALSSALESMIGEEQWLFNRRLFEEKASDS